MSLQGQQLIVMLGDLAACVRAPAAKGYHHREITIEVDDVCDDGAEVVRSYHLDLDDLGEIRFGLMQADFADMRERLRELEASGKPTTNAGLRHILQSPPREVAYV